MKKQEQNNIKIDIELPKYVKDAINSLEKNNHEAWIVGGFVRDALINPNTKCVDIDIATSAKWQDTKQIFTNLGWNVYDLGTKFGTVGVIPPDTNIKLEITTFRLEEKYDDGRHPNKISQAKTIEQDLKRRDFTINAIAYKPSVGIYDPYNGITSIRNKEIKTVGDPNIRFSEDYLRLLRAIRFESQLGFKLDKNTEASLYKLKNNIKQVSKERIRDEITKLLQGKHVKKILLKRKEILFTAITDLKALDGFDQKTKYHCYDVYKHTSVVVEKIPVNKYIHILNKQENNKINIISKWAALLHDIGKPKNFSIDSYGQGHFYGHPKSSAKMAAKILKNYAFSNKIINSICLVIRWHDLPMIDTKKSIKKAYAKFADHKTEINAYWLFKVYCDLRRADSLAHAPAYQENYKTTDKVEKIFDELYKQNLLITRKDLAFNGDDIIKMGVKPGPYISEILEKTYNAVLNEKVKNNKAELCKYVKQIIRNKAN